MVIGVDASQANAPERTGTEWYAFNLLHALAAIRGDETYRLYLETPLREDLRDLGTGFSARVLRWPFRRLWHQGRLSLELLVNAPDVFFAPAHALPLVHPARAYTTIHDVGFEDYPHLYPPVERLYHRFALRHALRTARRCIVPSRFTKERILAHFDVPEEKLVVVHHGFRAAQYRHDHESQQRVRRTYHLERPFFLFTGRIERKKNVVNLVHGFAAARRSGLTSHDLVLAGGPGHGIEEVRQAVQDHRLEKRVHLLGYVDASVLPALTACATAFVFLSAYEGFGFPVLEAFSTGTPVIISTSGSLPEIAGGAALAVETDAIEDIAAALRRLAGSSELRTSLVARGKARLKDFSWEQAARATREVLLG